MIALYPTRRDLQTDVVRGPVIIVERHQLSDGTAKWYTSVYANHITIDRRPHDSEADAILAACERDRDGVRLKSPASFTPADPTRVALDMGVAETPVEPDEP